MGSFRVVDARMSTPVPLDVTVEASSPEEAAQIALNLDLVRSGQKFIGPRLLGRQGPAQPDGAPVRKARKSVHPSCWLGKSLQRGKEPSALFMCQQTETICP